LGGDSVPLDKFQELLKPVGWVNDQVINFYLLLLARRDAELCERDSTRGGSFFFKTEFTIQLLQVHEDARMGGYNYDNVKRWLEVLRLASALRDPNSSPDKLFFPMNIGGCHWVIMVAFLGQNRIGFFDSLGDRDGEKGQKYGKHLLRFLQDLHKDMELAFPDPASWTIHSSVNSEIGRQRNGEFVLCLLIPLFYPTLSTNTHLSLDPFQAMIVASSRACSPTLLASVVRSASSKRTFPIAGFAWRTRFSRGGSIMGRRRRRRRALLRWLLGTNKPLSGHTNSGCGIVSLLARMKGWGGIRGTFFSC
jgi:Ulp1 protease family, C-terminal catalytic domain